MAKEVLFVPYNISLTSGPMPNPAAILFQDNWITGNLVNWGFASTPPPTVQSAVTNNGEPYAEEVNVTGPSGFQMFAGKDLGQDVNDLYVRAYIQVATLPDPETVTSFLPIRDSAVTNGTDVGMETFLTAGEAYFCVSDPSGNILVSAVPVKTGVFYSVEIRRKVGVGNGVLQVWINDTLAISTNTETIPTPGRFVYAGVSGNNATTPQTVYYADFVAGTAYNGPLTPPIINNWQDIYFYPYKMSTLEVFNNGPNDIIAMVNAASLPNGITVYANSSRVFSADKGIYTRIGFYCPTGSASIVLNAMR